MNWTSAKIVKIPSNTLIFIIYKFSNKGFVRQTETDRWTYENDFTELTFKNATVDFSDKQSSPSLTSKASPQFHKSEVIVILS